jgi:hypothetical protein
MGFTVPTFNLSVNVWRSGGTPPAPPDLVLFGNLAWGKRVQTGMADFDTLLSERIQLLLPAGSDVRSVVCAATADNVEVPAGSGRVYFVMFVDDIGKGFSNEHRVAVLQQRPTWPAPIP